MEDLLIGSDVRVYGCGLGTSSDYHDGCRGRVEKFSVARGCTTGLDEPSIGISFVDGSFDWFHPKQLTALKGEKNVRKKRDSG